VGRPCHGQEICDLIVFPAATVLGWLIGTALDRWLHTSWFYLVGLILGIVAGFVELIRTANK
jgi:F0F1-type ATP synthase assembly protein I